MKTCKIDRLKYQGNFKTQDGKNVSAVNLKSAQVGINITDLKVVSL